MTQLAKQTSRLRRAAAVLALVVVPLAPLTGCGGDSGGDSGGGGESEQSGGGEEDDGGAY